MPEDIRSLARAYTKRSIEILGGIAENSESDQARVSAIAQLLDRGWGRSPQPHTGADGESGLEITIRNIIEGKA